MCTFAVVVLCIQACLFQSALGQCSSCASVGDIGFAAPYGFAAPWGSAAPARANDGLAYAGLAGRGQAFDAPIGYGAAYGGAGEGNVAVAGELPVAGTTAVAGQVPIMGAVRFGGDVAAAGAVSISGKCACGCGAPF